MNNKEVNLDFESIEALNIGQKFVSQEEKTEAIRLKDYAFDLINKKDYELATETCNKAITLDPNLNSAYVYLGLINQQLNKIPLALQYYKTALKIDPTDSVTYNNIGAIYYRARKLELAKQYFQTALIYDKKNKSAKRNLAVFKNQTEKNYNLMRVLKYLFYIIIVLVGIRSSYLMLGVFGVVTFILVVIVWAFIDNKQDKAKSKKK